MDRKRIIYIGIILIITVIVSITYFSYAFFTKKDEYHGRLNIVAGELKYRIESANLENNSITLEANTTKEIEIEITSLNDINSEYSLYYDNSNVEIGYKEDSVDLPSGSINTGSKKKVTLIIKNKTNSSQTVAFGVKGGFDGKEVVLSSSDNGIEEFDGTMKLTFDANGGSTGTTEKDVAYNAEAGILPIPVRSGYTFKGWYTSSTAGDLVDATTIISNDMILYAQWIEGYYLRVGGNFAYAPYNEKVCSRFTGTGLSYDSYTKQGNNTVYMKPGTRITMYSYYGTGTVWYLTNGSTSTQICSNKANAYFTMPSYPIAVGIMDGWGGRDRTIRINRVDDQGNVLDNVTLSIGCS